ncbi:MAG: PKD domain-containing protein, partial [Gammaproteobacteria bacterium]|nr:PKD domain-containing protein [Gammaproteobacteria bacterium]
VKSPTSNNNPPETWLISPTQSQTIATGNSVYFNAAGSDPENHLLLRFYWDFAGVAPNSIGQTPGDVSFTQPGIYYVMVRAVDALGLADDTPAFVIITVQDQPQSNSAPNAIISPSTNQTISIGQSIVFQGNATDPDGNGPFTFRWDFGSVRPATSLQNPGSVLFDQAGVYTIRLTVWDDQRIVDATPAEITVTVNDGGNGGNRAPNGQISSPSRDITLNRGESVDFRGSASDPDGDGVSYRWDMDGVVPNTTRQNPGIVRFDKSGVYVIKLIVTDTKSLSDPTPPTRTITVR